MGERVADDAACHNVPVPVDELIGRDELVDEVLDELARTRLVTLVGPGGVGKSRVAVEAAWRTADSYELGAWFVELGGVAEASLVSSSIAAALSVSERFEDALDALVERLGDDRALVVLDNCEHQVDPVVEVTTALLRSCAGVRFVITSRAPLHLEAEAIIEVPPLAAPPAGLEAGAERSTVETSPAAQLFVRRAQARARSFSITDANAAAVGAICRRLDGMPLALELAAVWIDVLSPDEIERRLEDRFAFLVRAPHDLPARQADLRAVLDWSLALLDDEQRSFLEQLGVFPGWFRLPTVAAVTNTTEDRAADLLAGLIDRSLVRADATVALHRFSLLETTRVYTAERLRASGAWDAAMGRLAGTLAARAMELGQQLQNGEQVAPVGEVAADVDSYRACLGWLAEIGRWDGYLAIAVNIWHYFHTIGAVSEAVYWLRRGVDGSADDEAVQPLRGLALAFLGDTRRRQGALQEATELEEQSIEVFAAVPEPFGVAWAQTILAAIKAAGGDLATAQALLEDARRTFESAGRMAETAYILNGLGVLAERRGDREEGLRLLQDALALARTMDHQLRMAMPLANLGTIAIRQRDTAAARSWATELLDVGTAVGAKASVAVAHMELALAALLDGDVDGAEEVGARALALSRETGFVASEASTLELLGAAARLRGDIGRAAALQENALAIRARAGEVVAVGQSLVAISRLALEAGEDARAARWFAVALRLGTKSDFASYDSPEDVAAALEGVGSDTGAVRNPGPSTDATVTDALAWCRSMSKSGASAPAAGREAAPSLTTREAEILQLVAEGFSDRQIATRLGISERTVGTHLSTTYRKLGARNRTDAVRLSKRGGSD